MFETVNIIPYRKIIPALAVNSMIVGARDFEEAFELAAMVEEKLGIRAVVDLHSRRDPSTDNEGLWSGAYENSSFDITNAHCLMRAISLGRKYNQSVIGTSVYLGAFNQQDLEYGKKVIEGAIKLTQIAPHNTIIVKILGGNKKCIMEQRSKHIVLSNLQKLAEFISCAEKEYKQQTGIDSKIITGLEIHQGQYPENIGDTVEIYESLRKVSEEFLDHIGIIENPANRYISTFGVYLNPILAARMIQNAGGRIIYYHLKDVIFIDKWAGYKNKHMWIEGFQKIGSGTLFEFDNKIFEWKTPGEGDINFQDCVTAAMEYSDPPHEIIGFSTEHVPASKNREEAWNIIMRYAKFIAEKSSDYHFLINIL